MSIYQDLKKQLKLKGLEIINTDFYNNIREWKEWYSGFCPNFHNYTVKLAD